MFTHIGQPEDWKTRISLGFRVAYNIKIKSVKDVGTSLVHLAPQIDVAGLALQADGSPPPPPTHTHTQSVWFWSHQLKGKRRPSPVQMTPGITGSHKNQGGPQIVLFSPQVAALTGV